MSQSTQLETSKKLDNVVATVLGEKTITGFIRAHAIATATLELQLLLTPEYMKPIMALQGTSLGFKTDKDGKGGYAEEVVKKCLIQATLYGVQPYNNQFNIIADNMYITKEGYGFLLKIMEGLNYKIIPELPRISTGSTSAALVMKIKWTYQGVAGEESIDFPIKMNQYMGTDAVIGKAMRKARKWLYDYLTGSETPDGDVVDYDAQVVSSRPLIDKEQERIELMLQDCLTIPELNNLKKDIPVKYLDLYNARWEELNKK